MIIYNVVISHTILYNWVFFITHFTINNKYIIKFSLYFNQIQISIQIIYTTNLIIIYFLFIKQKVKSYKRLPWLKIWLKETYELAKTLCAYADEDNPKESDILASQNDLKKKIKTQESTSKLPSKIQGDESEQQTPYSPDFNKIPFQNNQTNKITSGSLSSASKLKAGSPSNENQKQEYNAILNKHKQLEEASNQKDSNQQLGEWKIPDTVKRSPTRNDEGEFPVTDSIKNFGAPKPKKSSELSQNDIQGVQQNHTDKGSQPQQIVKHEENEHSISEAILKDLQKTLNSTIV